MIARATWIAEIRKWVGTPWLHQGRNHLGVDCIGLIICAARDLGLTTFDTTAYGRAPDYDYLLQACEANLTREVKAEPGHILVMRLSRFPQHFGVLVEPGRIVHARGDTGKVVETVMPAVWWRRVDGIYSVPGVA